MNGLWKLLAIIVSVFLIGYFLEETIDISGINNPESLEETFEIISELFSVFVALSIFSITWHAYYKSRDNNSLFIGTIFLITHLRQIKDNIHIGRAPYVKKSVPNYLTPIDFKNSFFTI